MYRIHATSTVNSEVYQNFSCNPGMITPTAGRPLNIERGVPEYRPEPSTTNLNLLAEIGEIRSFPGNRTGSFRRQPCSTLIFHLPLRLCDGSYGELLDHINILAGQDFDGEIEGHILLILRRMPSCKASENADPFSQKLQKDIDKSFLQFKISNSYYYLISKQNFIK